MKRLGIPETKALGPVLLLCWAGAILLLPACSGRSSAFTFADDPVQGTMTIRDGALDVLSFRYRNQLPAGVDLKYVHSGYIHPLFGLDGEILSADFPADHLNHHGLFWTWPIVRTRGVNTGTWEPAEPGLRQRFVRWAEKSLRNGAAILAVESDLKFDRGEAVARERAEIRVHPADDAGRSIDIALTIEAVGGPLELQGSQDAGEGYGGLCFRGTPAFKGAALTTDRGPQKEDAVHTPFLWADLSTPKGGIAIFTSPDHPGAPIPWLIRNSYAGILNPSWPGLRSARIEAGTSVVLRYRVYIHRGAAAGRVAERYAAYLTAVPLPSEKKEKTMGVQFESTEVIDRPIDKVFRFYAVEHVRNHPRWDSDIELWMDSDAPIGVGTVIRRRNKRGGVPVEGTMRVLEFEPNRVLAMEIHDGPSVMYGRTMFEGIDENRTRITTWIDIPWMDTNADKTFMNNRLAEVSRIRKRLMESEL